MKQRLSQGVTLVEMLVVLALVAVAMGTLLFSSSRSDDALVEQDARKLAAVLEVARAKAVSEQVAYVWQPVDEGYAVLAGGREITRHQWSSRQIWAQPATPVLISPEPLGTTLQIAVRSLNTPEASWVVATDGVQAIQAARTSSP